MTVESLIFGEPDQAIMWVDELLPVLEKAGFRHLPNVVGQTAILIDNDPLTHGLSVIKTGTDRYRDRLNFTQFAGMHTLTSQVWSHSEKLRCAEFNLI